MYNCYRTKYIHIISCNCGSFIILKKYTAITGQIVTTNYLLVHCTTYYIGNLSCQLYCYNVVCKSVVKVMNIKMRT